MITITEKQNVKLPGESSLFVSFNYNANIVEQLKQCPVYNYDKNTHIWEVPCTSLSKLLDNLCSIDDITVSFLPTVEKNSSNNYNDIEIGPFKTKPFSYQEEGIKYGLLHDSWLLLDAPGLGKSLQLIYLAEELKKRDNIEHCLIVCGVNALKANWKKEIQTQ